MYAKSLGKAGEEAIKDGAYDFLSKPVPMDELVVSMRRAAQKRKLVMENRQLRALHLGGKDGQDLLLGDSAMMVHLRQTLAQVANAGIDVLITGDTGAGKERVAQSLHRISDRRGRPLVHINCASLPEETYHVELFGAAPMARAAGLLSLHRTTVPQR